MNAEWRSEYGSSRFKSRPGWSCWSVNDSMGSMNHNMRRKLKVVKIAMRTLKETLAFKNGWSLKESPRTGSSWPSRPNRRSRVQDDTTHAKYTRSADESYQAPQGGGIDEHIHKAVSYALQHKEMQERQAHEAQSRHIFKGSIRISKNILITLAINTMTFTIPCWRDTPYTASMRDYAVTLPRSGAGAPGSAL